MTGRIIKGIGGFYYVDTMIGTIECKARGIFRNKNIKPMIGDIVDIEWSDDSETTGTIIDIMDRKNALIRPAVANIDQVIIVFAVSQPDPHLDLLDKFLLLAEEKHIDVIICFNKIDMQQPEAYAEMVEIYTKIGYTVLLTCAKNFVGIDVLRQYLSHKTTVLAGPSGVGKSSLMNDLMDEEVMPIGVISEKIQRGKHTTRHAEIIKLQSESYLVDTPGFSSLELFTQNPDEIMVLFKEFQPFLGQCRFDNCMHLKEPGCAVKSAVDEQIVYKGRYEHYVTLVNQLQNQKRW